MPQIRPITDLRNIYETMVETVETDAVITKAEAEFQRDEQLFDAREALTALRRKHFG